MASSAFYRFSASYVQGSAAAAIAYGGGLCLRDERIIGGVLVPQLHHRHPAAHRGEDGLHERARRHQIRIGDEAQRERARIKHG